MRVSLFASKIRTMTSLPASIASGAPNAFARELISRTFGLRDVVLAQRSAAAAA